MGCGRSSCKTCLNDCNIRLIGCGKIVCISAKSKIIYDSTVEKNLELAVENKLTDTKSQGESK
jgi:hypothetical protein